MADAIEGGTPGRRLSDRKAAILDAVIRHYIRTGEPAGSEAIAASSALGVSPATIRNELAALEDLGYLTHRHTSAGRIPTEAGYRHYVNLLPARPRLRDAERRAIVHFFDEALADVDEILRGTTVLLARLTHHASLALPPHVPEREIVRVELVPLGGASGLVLVVFDTGRVVKRGMELPRDFDERAAEDLAHAANAVVRGKSASAGQTEIRRLAKREHGDRRVVLGRIADALASIDEAAETEHVVFGGAAHIAAEEAFRRRETLREIFEALERESEILRLLRDAASRPEVSVTIGREHPVTGIWEASVVAAPYGPGGRGLGTIGVVGPTRMDYAAAISAVRAVAERLSAAVEALGG